MNAKKLELIGLASLAAVSIVAVGLATMGRGAIPTVGQTDLLVSASLITNAQASPIERAAAPKPDVAKAAEEIPIYLDLGAKF
jgi:hypothetical protein